MPGASCRVMVYSLTQICIGDDLAIAQRLDPGHVSGDLDPTAESPVGLIGGIQARCARVNDLGPVAWDPPPGYRQTAAVSASRPRRRGLLGREPVQLPLRPGVRLRHPNPASWRCRYASPSFLARGWSGPAIVADYRPEVLRGGGPRRRVPSTAIDPTKQRSQLTLPRFWNKVAIQAT